MTVFDSKYVNIEKIADGVYVSVALSATTGSNSTIVDVGEQVLVVDTHMTPTGAAEVRRAAEQLTGKSVSYVLITHNHFDHVMGNQIYHETPIISTPATRDLIAERIPGRIQDFHENQIPTLEQQLSELQEKLSTADDSERADLQLQILDAEVFLKDAPTAEMHLPSITFENKLVWHGSKRRAEFIHMGIGHSGSDSILWLPDDAIAILADLLVVGYTPYMHDGDVANWLRMLEQIEAMNPKIVVPGHGPVATLTAFADMREHLNGAV